MKHYQLHDNPQGAYIRQDGLRCDLLCVGNIRTAQGLNVGWAPFASLEDCLTAWGLTYQPYSGSEE